MEHHAPQEPIFEFDQITDNIYIGSNQCCVTHFDERLINEGVAADISLEDTRIDAPFGVESFLWLPTPDHMSPTPDQLKQGVAQLTQLIAMGKKVYVHCRLGHGRAPTLVAAYLISAGKTTDEAIAFIKTKRSVAHLEDAQVKALKEFEANI